MAVLEDLVEVRPHAEIIERWLESPMVSWRWICRWLHVIMTNTGSSAAWKPAAVRLPTGFDERKLMQLWELALHGHRDRKSTRLNSSHVAISYAVFCLNKKTM